MTDKIEALREALADRHSSYSERADAALSAAPAAVALADECERLRAALQQIADKPHAPDAYIVAIEALKEQK